MASMTIWRTPASTSFSEIVVEVAGSRALEGTERSAELGFEDVVCFLAVQRAAQSPPTARQKISAYGSTASGARSYGPRPRAATNNAAEPTLVVTSSCHRGLHQAEATLPTRTERKNTKVLRATPMCLAYWVDDRRGAG